MLRPEENKLAFDPATKAEVSLLTSKVDTKTLFLVGGGVDDTAKAIQAFQSLQEGWTLQIKGRVVLKQELVVSGKKGITIKGDGSKVSYFVNQTGGKSVKFSNSKYVTVDGVGFYGNGDEYTFGTGATNGDGLELTNCEHWNFNSCEFSYNGGNGVNLVDGCWVLNFVNCRFVGNLLNGFYGTIKTTLQACAINFTNPLIWGNKQSGILWSSTGLSVIGGVIENNDIGINFDCVEAKAPAMGVQVCGVDFELNKSGHIKFKTSSTNTAVGIIVEGCHFTDNGSAVKEFIWAEGILPVQSVKISNNAYTGYSSVNVLNFQGLTLGTCSIDIPRGLESKFINLGLSKVFGFIKKISISGLLEQKGIPFAKLDKSDNLVPITSPEGIWKLPVQASGYLNGLDMYVETDATTDYSVLFSLFRLNENGAMTPSFTYTATKSGGGSGKLSFSNIGLIVNHTSFDSLYVKTTITKPTTGTTFYVKNLTFVGETN